MNSIPLRIKELIDIKNMNISSFEKKIGAGNNSIGTIINRNSNVSGAILSKILITFEDVSADYLLTGKGKLLHDSMTFKDDHQKIEDQTKVFKMKTDGLLQKQSVPLYDVQASASVIALFRDHSSQQPIDHITIPNLPKCDGAIYVSGDSMYPLLKSGDIIMYKKVENVLDSIFWGEMYLVSIISDYGDEFIMIKWLQRSEQGKDFVKLVSENRHHQPTEFHIKNIKGLALIKASVRINSMH